MRALLFGTNLFTGDATLFLFARHAHRPPNVPPLSCGRIRKRGGQQVATSEPVVLHHGREGGGTGGDEARPSASTACWAAFGCRAPRSVSARRLSLSLSRKAKAQVFREEGECLAIAWVPELC